MLTPKGFAAVKSFAQMDSWQRGAALARLLQKGFSLTAQAAAGIAGNLHYESTGLQANINEGMIHGAPRFRGGFGYAQWTGIRQRQFLDWCQSQSLDPQTHEANVGFLLHELKNTPEKKAIDRLRGITDVAEATRVFERTYERAGVLAHSKRIAAAERIYQGMGSVPVIADNTVSKPSPRPAAAVKQALETPVPPKPPIQEEIKQVKDITRPPPVLAATPPQPSSVPTAKELALV